MPNRSAEAVFQLIKSFTKAEKRNFKLFATRNSDAGQFKTIQLFDALDKMDDYDEGALLKKNPALRKEQLPNLKAQLYRLLLASLRIISGQEAVEIMLHEQLQHALILYDRGLYHQSLRLLERCRDQADHFQQNTFLLQILTFEKKIENLHITRAAEARASELAHQIAALNQRLALIGQASNLALQLYHWYIRIGHARNHHDLRAIKAFYDSLAPTQPPNTTDFYCRLYHYQAQSWYAFIAQDFLQYYRATSRWVGVFDDFPQMIALELPYYLKGLHNLLTAHFMLRNHARFDQTLADLEALATTEAANRNIGAAAQVFIYTYLARINSHFLKGTFSEGLALVPDFEDGIARFYHQIDQHRVLVFDYKIACLYFGSGNYEKTIDYLLRIIHAKTSLRSDLQCYARLLHLIAHYELGNGQLLQHLIKSVYRFMAKMDNLSRVEEEIFLFLKKSFSLNHPSKIRQAFIRLRNQLSGIVTDRFETRSFMYLDIVSWLESKINDQPVQAILQRRYAAELEAKAAKR